MAFASTTKALLPLLNAAPELNPQAVSCYFHYGYVSGSEGIVQGISSLGPGQWLEIDCRTFKEIQGTYWDPAEHMRPTAALVGSTGQLREELEALLLDSLEKRLIADVPICLFLSGGVDSSLLACLLDKKMRRGQ